MMVGDKGFDRDNLRQQPAEHVPATASRTNPAFERTAVSKKALKAVSPSEKIVLSPATFALLKHQTREAGTSVPFPHSILHHQQLHQIRQLKVFKNGHASTALVIACEMPALVEALFLSWHFAALPHASGTTTSTSFHAMPLLPMTPRIDSYLIIRLSSRQHSHWPRAFCLAPSMLGKYVKSRFVIALIG
jgi:hypothetical protein